MLGGECSFKTHLWAWAGGRVTGAAVRRECPEQEPWAARVRSGIAVLTAAVHRWAQGQRTVSREVQAWGRLSWILRRVQVAGTWSARMFFKEGRLVSAARRRQWKPSRLIREPWKLDSPPPGLLCLSPLLFARWAETFLQGRASLPGQGCEGSLGWIRQPTDMGHAVGPRVWVEAGSVAVPSGERTTPPGKCDGPLPF